LKRRFLVWLLLLVALCLPATAWAQVAMKEGNYEKWIDRIEISREIREQLMDFYRCLEEGADGDGEADVLITDEKDALLLFRCRGREKDREQAMKQTDALFDAYEPYIGAVYQAFERDHPEVFWLSGTYQVVSDSVISSDGSYEMTFSFLLREEGFDLRAPAYREADAIYAGIARREKRVQQILKGARGLDKAETLGYLNDVLTNTNEYNTSRDLRQAASDCWSCLSALQGQSGKDGPVCEGYARAFQVLCRRAGIPCVLVDGKIRGEDHMWNYVQLQGGWYAVDVTWNDPLIKSGGFGKMSGKENRDYFLVGAETLVNGTAFSESHREINTPDGKLCFANGPKLERQAYGAKK